jgi:hypothetical protein
MISLSLNRPDADAKYMVKTIIGLDADEIIPRFYGFGAVTSPKYYDLGLKSREIVMRVVLNPNYYIQESPSEIRDELYRAVSSNRTGTVTLLFNDGASAVATISGFVTKFEVPYFSRIPEVQITVTCEDPMFRAINPVILYSDDLATGTPIMVADSISTAPHGLEMKFTVSSTFTNFLIRDNADSEWKFEVIPGLLSGATPGFISGDVVTLSSNHEDKRLVVTRSAVDYHLGNKVTTDSIWPIIFPGANEFHLDNTDKFAWNHISFYPAYWGV